MFLDLFAPVLPCKRNYLYLSGTSPGKVKGEKKVCLDINSIVWHLWVCLCYSVLQYIHLGVNSHIYPTCPTSANTIIGYIHLGAISICQEIESLKKSYRHTLLQKVMQQYAFLHKTPRNKAIFFALKVFWNVHMHSIIARKLYCKHWIRAGAMHLRLIRLVQIICS